MKRTGLIALGVGLAAILSGCLVVVDQPTVRLTGLVTTWEIRNTGEDVICDNKNTDVYYQFSYSNLGDILNWRESWTGRAPTTPTYTETRVPSNSTQGVSLPAQVSVDDAAKLITVRLTFTPGTPGSPYPSPFRVAQQSTVSPQSINVTPVPFVPTSETGTAVVTITVNFQGGGSATIVPSRLIKVFSGC